MKTLLVWTVQCYNGSIGEHMEKLVDVVIIQILAKTEQQAIEKAQSLIKKNHYRISTVIEQMMPGSHIDEMRKPPWEHNIE